MYIFFKLVLVNYNNPWTNTNSNEQLYLYEIKFLKSVFYIPECEHACFSQIIQPLKGWVMLIKMYSE